MITEQERMAPYALAAGHTGGMLGNFARHVEVNAGGCWIWKGGVTADGSPKSRDGKATVQVRRRLYEEVSGKIEGRWVVAATCDEPLCVNPEHVELRTLADIHRRDVCKRGHDISTPDKRVGGDPLGACLQCVARRGREYRARQKDAEE